MKLCILALSIFTMMTQVANARELNVNVQCGALGPVFKGKMEFPTEPSEWIVREIPKYNSVCEVLPKNPVVKFFVNNLDYIGEIQSSERYKPIDLKDVDCSDIKEDDYREFYYVGQISVLNQLGTQGIINFGFTRQNETRKKAYTHFRLGAVGQACSVTINN